MAGFAFVASRTGRPAEATTISRMAEAAPHRGPGRVNRGDGGGAAAAAQGGGVATATDAAGRLIVADTRLDDLATFARSLGHAPGSIDDPALILEAYERWGDHCVDHLLGDFAFVIWDAPRARVFAARDIFGMRPLFYSVTADHVLAASEIAQILEAPGVPRRLDERSVLASLVGNAQSPRWTHFQSVRRLRPGHILQIDERSARTSEYWRPPDRASDRQAPGTEYAAELRSLLAVAVRDRMTGPDAPGLMLSGGVDSASIAASAARLTADEPSLPTLATYSFAYDRFPECDERVVSDQVIARTGQTNTLVPTDDAFPLAGYPDHPPELNGPDLLQSHLVLRRAADLARDAGVSLLMSGHRADPLFSEAGFDYLGMLRADGPRAVWRQAGAQAQRHETGRRRVLYFDLARRTPAAVWPRYRWTRARDWLRRVVPGAAQRPPWIRPDAVAAHGLQRDAADAVTPSRLAGDARRRRHEAILQPRHAASAEYMERSFARAGIRYADPWSDRRIADWVLSVPPHRLNSDGVDKWVLREAMRGLLPEAARDGAFRANPGPFYEYGLLQGAESTVRTLLTNPLTAQRGYVDADALLAAYERYQGGHWPGLPQWNAFWRWLAWERWLRTHDS